MLMNMLKSDQKSVQTEGIQACGLLMDRLGGAFAVEALRAGIMDALLPLLPRPNVPNMTM